jgi:hypothetical protein
VSGAKSSCVKKKSEFLRGSYWRVLESEAESGLRKGLNNMTFKKEKKQIGSREMRTRETKAHPKAVHGSAGSSFES